MQLLLVGFVIIIAALVVSVFGYWLWVRSLFKKR